MRNKNLISFLLSTTILLIACSGLSGTPITVEVTRIIKETVIVTQAQSPRLSVEITQGISLPVPHTRHTATRLLNGRILVVGGYTGENVSLAAVDLFDPMTGSITSVAPLHTPRHDHSATLLRDGRVLVVGGYNPQQQWLTDAEVYDPFDDTWIMVPPLYSHGVAHTATLLKDGRVLVTGGGIGSGVCTERAEIFDPQTNSWTEAPSLPTQRNGHTADLLNDGRVLVAGGVNAIGHTVGGDAFLYDPKANNWTVTAPMVTQRAFASSVQLKDGRILIAGGVAADGSPVWQMIANAEIFDPASSTWSATASLAEARFAYVLTLLPNGQVLAIGGTRDHDSHWSESSFVREVEVYDPHRNGWKIVGEIHQPGAFAAGVLFHDGRLWVTGGYTSQAEVTILQDTWIISPLYLSP